MVSLDLIQYLKISRWAT